MLQLLIKNNRKKYILDPKFQLTFVSHLVAISMWVTLISYIANHYFFVSMSKMGLKSGLASDHIFFAFLKSQEKLMNQIFVISSVLNISIVFFYGILMSHKISGPIYRLKKFLIEFDSNSTDKSKIKFRDGDFFINIQDILNSFIERNIKK